MEQIESQVTISTAFSGHRFIPYSQRERLRASLTKTVISHYKIGTCNFICGMAMGFDMLAAETVLALKNEYQDITLTAVVPFRNQFAKYSTEDKKRYQDIMGKADKVIILSETYYDGCFLRRNDYMLNHSSRLIAYFNGEKKGGTFYTWRKALQMGLPAANLY